MLGIIKKLMRNEDKEQTIKKYTVEGVELTREEYKEYRKLANRGSYYERDFLKTMKKKQDDKKNADRAKDMVYSKIKNFNGKQISYHDFIRKFGGNGTFRYVSTYKDFFEDNKIHIKENIFLDGLIIGEFATEGYINKPTLHNRNEKESIIYINQSSNIQHVIEGKDSVLIYIKVNGTARTYSNVVYILHN
ncbi:hypothetical protein [Robertmurraya mangrovi]|uniref:hypothetical protein n=1 Tax=Robertmurraya mangrovi TaxID=3098077 RepID=UPI002ACC2179|nr:hypothetical protein [Bacillus sp. 31A1R]